MKIYKEYDRQYAANSKTHPWAVIASKIRDATDIEVEDARKIFKQTGECDHSLIKDKAGWMYDFRSCAICETGLGTV